MTFEIPAAVSHLSQDDAAELTRMLMAVFKGDEPAAAKWLTGRSEYFDCPPLELLKRDELGVVRVLSYLRDAVQ